MSKKTEIRELYVYDGGQSLVEFIFDFENEDYFVWNGRQRLAEYKCPNRLMEAFEDSDNCEGAYDCAELHL